jgi:hypothetical protein
LSLLLRCFVKFSLGVVVEASVKYLKNFRGRLTRSAYDEDPIETALVFSIRVGQSELHRDLRVFYVPLLLRRPFYRL